MMESHRVMQDEFVSFLWLVERSTTIRDSDRRRRMFWGFILILVISDGCNAFTQHDGYSLTALATKGTVAKRSDDYFNEVGKNRFL